MRPDVRSIPSFESGHFGSLPTEGFGRHLGRLDVGRGHRRAAFASGDQHLAEKTSGELENASACTP